MENELGLREFLEKRGHEYVVTDSKDGEGNELDKHLPDTDVVSYEQRKAPPCRKFMSSI